MATAEFRQLDKCAYAYEHCSRIIGGGEVGVDWGALFTVLSDCRWCSGAVRIGVRSQNAGYVVL